MLDANLKDQLKAYLERVSLPFEIVASLDDGEKSQELLGLLNDIVSLTDKITLKTDGNDARRPSFALNRPGEDTGVVFAGIPMGHEFTSLVLALLQVGGHPSKLDAETIEQIKSIEGRFEFETYFSLSCQNCPDAFQALNLMAVLNPNIRNVSIDGALFQEEVERRQIMAVPSVYLNGEVFASGRMEVKEILAKIDTGAANRDAEKMSAKDAFDVLVVGGNRRVLLLRSTPRVKVSVLPLPPSALAVRCWTPWPSRTLSRSRKPKARNWCVLWRNTSRNTRST